MKNKMYRSIAALVLIIVMAATGGCASSGGGDGAMSDSGAKKETKKEEKEEKKGLDITAEIKEQVLVDKDGLKITATGLGSDREDSFFIELSVQNDTEQVYEARADHFVVNGYDMWGGMDYIKPGEAKMQLDINSLVFKYAEIGEPGEIEINSLRVCEAVEKETQDGEDTYYDVERDKYENPFFKEEKIVIQTSAYDKMSDAALPDGEELYNENGIRLVRIAADEEDQENMGYRDIFFLKNDSSDRIETSAKEEAVNDFVIDRWTTGFGVVDYAYVEPGCTGVFWSGADPTMLSFAIGEGEEVEIESMECTILINKTVYDEVYDVEVPETIAEIPYSYTAE